MIIIILILFLVLFLLFNRRNILSFLHAAFSLTGNPAVAAIFSRPRLDQDQCEIEIIGADLNDKGPSYDTFSKPDPFIIVKHHLTEFKTETERNTYHPRFLFKSRMQLATHKKKGFLFEMRENDVLGEDKVIGRAFLSAEEVIKMMDTKKSKIVSLGHGIGVMKVRITKMDDKYKEKREKRGIFKFMSPTVVQKLHEILDDDEDETSVVESQAENSHPSSTQQIIQTQEKKKWQLKMPKLKKPRTHDIIAPEPLIRSDSIMTGQTGNLSQSVKEFYSNSPREGNHLTKKKSSRQRKRPSWRCIPSSDDVIQLQPLSRSDSDLSASALRDSQSLPKNDSATEGKNHLIVSITKKTK